MKLSDCVPIIERLSALSGGAEQVKAEVIAIIKKSGLLTPETRRAHFLCMSDDMARVINMIAKSNILIGSIFSNVMAGIGDPSDFRRKFLELDLLIDSIASIGHRHHYAQGLEKGR